jgi:hypothetical protein
MRRTLLVVAVGAGLGMAAAPLPAQTATDDPVLRRIWAEGMETRSGRG